MYGTDDTAAEVTAPYVHADGVLITPCKRAAPSGLAKSTTANCYVMTAQKCSLNTLFKPVLVDTWQACRFSGIVHVLTKLALGGWL